MVVAVFARNRNFVKLVHFNSIHYVNGNIFWNYGDMFLNRSYILFLLNWRHFLGVGILHINRTILHIVIVIQMQV
jgi:hypothetical protein